MHTAVLYDGLRTVVENSELWQTEAQPAARAIGNLGPDYIQDTIHRLLADKSPHFCKRIVQFGELAIPILRRVIETEPHNRIAAISCLYHMSGPQVSAHLLDLMNSYGADVRFAVARVIVDDMTRSQGSISSMPALHSIIPRVFEVYGEFVLATAQSNGYERVQLLEPYEQVSLLSTGGHVQREAVIPVLTALLTASDADIYLRKRAAQLLFYFDSSGYVSRVVSVSWVEEPALWARDQEDTLLRLAYLANLAEINRPQENWRSQMVVPHIGQLYGRPTGNAIGLIDTRTGVEKIYPRNPNWHDVVRQFQDWERSGRNDPHVIAAAQTILDGGEFTYQMAFEMTAAGGGA